MRIAAYAFALAAALGAPLAGSPAAAQGLIDSYVARISPQDHVNSRGVRLTTAAAILRQDRANVHRFGLRDAEDQIDRVFADAEGREQMELFVASAQADDALDQWDMEAIVSGNPLVRVEVYDGFLTITILQK